MKMQLMIYMMKCSKDRHVTHCVNHVVHQLVNFGPLEPRLPAVPHDFGVGSCGNIQQNGER